MDYNFSKPPKALYKNNFSKENDYLPKVVFNSYYIKQSFNAVAVDNINATRFFIDNYNYTKDINNITGDTMLIWGAKNNSLNSVRLLLAKGVNANQRNFKGRTGLHYATEIGNKILVKIFLTMGASFDLKDINGVTPRDIAFMKKDYEIMQMFDSYQLDNYSLPK